MAEAWMFFQVPPFNVNGLQKSQMKKNIMSFDFLKQTIPTFCSVCWDSMVAIIPLLHTTSHDTGVNRVRLAG